MGAGPVRARAWSVVRFISVLDGWNFGGSGRAFSGGISDGPPRRFARTPRAPRAWVPYISPSLLPPFSGLLMVVMLSMGMLSLMYVLVAYGMLTWGYGYGMVLL